MLLSYLNPAKIKDKNTLSNKRVVLLIQRITLLIAKLGAHTCMYIYSVVYNKLLKSFLVFLPNIVDRIMATPELTVAAVPSAQAQEAFRDQNGGPLATIQIQN